MSLFNMTIATENETLLDDTAYTQITTAFSSDNVIKNIIEGALLSVFADYYNISIFVLIGFMLYMMWQDQRSAVIPTLVIVLCGSMLFTIIPAAMVTYVKLFAIMTMAGVIVKMYMDRR